jgi:hypothetical protein
MATLIISTARKALRYSVCRIARSPNGPVAVAATT